jgi:flagellar motor switch protein FliN/FliY
MAPTELLEKAKASADRIGDSVSELLGAPTVVQITDLAEASGLASELAACFAISGDGGTLFVSSGIVEALHPGDSPEDQGVQLLSDFARRAWPVVSTTVGATSDATADVNVRRPGVADLGAILGSSVIAAIVNIHDVPIEAYMHFSPIASQTSDESPRGEAQSLRLDELEGTGTMNANGIGLDILGDVEVNVTVELGRRRIPLNELLKLTRGSIIELEKLVGEPLEVYVNNRLIADGEAVVIDDHFGIRITNVIPSIQRNG